MRTFLDRRNDRSPEELASSISGSVKNFLGLWVVFLATMMGAPLLLTGADFPSPSLSAKNSSPIYHTLSEQTVFREINRLRAKNGIPELKVNPMVQQLARRQSSCMARYGLFAHHDEVGRGLKERLSAKDSLRFRLASENIAKNRGFEDPAIQAVEDWVHSPGHLQAILNRKFTETGIGAVMDSHGTFLFTQIFLAK